jgi:hypothetical protein
MALGPTQPSIQWVPGVLSLGIKRPGRESDHSPPSSGGQRICGAIPPLPQYAFMEWCLVKAQGQLYLYLYCILNVVKKKDVSCPSKKLVSTIN